jgi:acetate kinase
MAILVLNSGSSSLKLALVDPDTGKRSFDGVAERIGGPDAVLTARWSGKEEDRRFAHGDHAEALAAALDVMGHAGLRDRVEAVGHRVVHGGETFSASVLVDDAVVASIDAASKLAPLHNPANLLGIKAARAAFAGVPEVAVFDTAFHQTIPPRAFRYAVPYAWYQEYGVRKYGFHGTSHRYVSSEAAVVLGRPLEELRLLTAHLGNGCSACAVQGGRSMDTTMGLTPLAGLVMGTRSGDVDPGLVAYMAERLGIDAAGITVDLNQRSGLLGLSCSSNDMRTLLGARAEGDKEAALAIDVFCYRAAASLLALAAALDGLDAVIFTGGIGEHAAPVRAQIGALLWPLQVSIDPDANARTDAPCRSIHRAGSRPLWVIPTDEELMIARDTRQCVERASTKHR